MINSLLHFKDRESILNYLRSNPTFISGFTNGEGSFTSSFMFSPRAMWAVWPQCKFNITQLMNDKILLEAINDFFGGIGGVYTRENNVGTFSVRKINALWEVIIPFFLKYPSTIVESLKVTS